MARCPDCNKFVPNGEPEVEIQNEEVVDEMITIEVRVMIPCEECGTELKEAYMTLEHEIAHECDSKFQREDGQEYNEEEDEQYELESVDASPHDRYDDIGKNGKKKKWNARMKRFYGAEVTMDIKCNKCG
jgi:hypothetical protein